MDIYTSVAVEQVVVTTRSAAINTPYLVVTRLRNRVKSLMESGIHPIKEIKYAAMLVLMIVLKTNGL